MNALQLNNQYSNSSINNISFYDAIRNYVVENKIRAIFDLILNVVPLICLIVMPEFIQIFHLYWIGTAILNMGIGFTACQLLIDKQFQQKAHRG